MIKEKIRQIKLTRSKDEIKGRIIESGQYTIPNTGIVIDNGGTAEDGTAIFITEVDTLAIEHTMEKHHTEDSININLEKMGYPSIEEFESICEVIIEQGEMGGVVGSFYHIQFEI